MFNLTMPKKIDTLKELAALVGKTEDELRNATELDLSNRNIEKLPENFGELQKLSSLNLRNNRLDTLPESLTKLQNLTSLDLARNKIKTLPESVTKLRNLTSLDLGSNKIETLPENIGELQKLTSLNLYHNKIETLPESLGELQNLTSLDLDGNKIETLPENLGELQNLTSLELRGNKIKTLPESLTKLQKLTSLDLSYNKIETLPASLTKLQKLTSLDLEFNKIETLPESLGELQKLSSLDLRNNNLKTLPELKRLTRLHRLDLRGNRLSQPIPQSLAGWGPEIMPLLLGIGGKKPTFGARLFLKWFRPPPEKRAPYSVLAIFETITATCLAAILGHYAPEYLIAACLLAPFFLLRTNVSTRLSLDWTERWGKRLNIKDYKDKFGIRQLYRLPLYAVGAWGIKIASTCYPFLKYKLGYLRVMLRRLPANYYYQLTRINIRTAPEIVPGLEKRFHGNTAGLLSFFEIAFDPAQSEYTYAYLYQNKFKRLIQITTLPIIFIVALLYRYTVKLSVLFYLPLIFVNAFLLLEKPVSKKSETSKKDVKDWMALLLFFIFGLIAWQNKNPLSFWGEFISHNLKNLIPPNWLETFKSQSLILINWLNSFSSSYPSFFDELTELLPFFILVFYYGFGFFIRLFSMIANWRPEKAGPRFFALLAFWTTILRDICVFVFIGIVFHFYISRILFEWFMGMTAPLLTG